jgi:putative addiction module component (TIGR02574 family)
MNERVKKLSEEIRRLAPDEQAELVLAIRDPDPNVEQAWAAEAERRLDAWERGETDAVPAEDVIDRLRSRFPR